ncbi:hypothetical protein J437_LFUL013949 [Ladona fulva]|uniref:Reverse transcriptase domain-containing protein n=1 Tax=Ladona fulva TaxID=123851 RepID=A0A8K0KF24_LADFU|nr:hypothetical protein J437_LFUL013949 [Ladona fulva]
MKNREAIGSDQIPVEKGFGTEKMPDEWRSGICILIYKGMGDVQDCESYRGIRLISHTMKTWKRIIEGRLRLEMEICDEQFGFMQGRGTTDAIFA